MKQTLTEIKALLENVSVKGTDVLYMAEVIMRVNKLINECEAPKEGE